MMGYSHALTGVIISGAVVSVSPAPWPVNTLAILVCGGAALLPDIDHPSSTVAHSLGPVTVALSHLTNRVALTIYHATRTPRDPAERTGGHRLITHVPVGALTFGLIAEVACLVSNIGVGIVCGLVVGLLAAGLRRTVRKLARFLFGIREGAGLLLAGVSGVSGYLVSGWYPGWSWVYGVVVAIGCHIHREGDWCTNSGVPRRLWPKIKDGRRWDKDKAPVTFETGKDTELHTVQPLLTLAAVVSIAAACGVLIPTLSLVIHGVGALINGGTQ